MSVNRWSGSTINLKSLLSCLFIFSLIICSIHDQMNPEATCWIAINSRRGKDRFNVVVEIEWEAILIKEKKSRSMNSSRSKNYSSNRNNSRRIDGRTNRGRGWISPPSIELENSDSSSSSDYCRMPANKIVLSEQVLELR